MNKTREIICLCQCAGFVGKDVLNLSKVIGQIPTAGKCSLAVMHHLEIEVNKCGLTSLDEFDGYI